MAFVKCKGTVLQQTIEAAFVAIGQIIDLDGPGMESETYEADTLDNANAGIPYKPTGRTEGGSLSGNLFFDPVLQAHENYLWYLTNPEVEQWKIIFADAATTEWPFSGAGVSFSPAVALNDGLKASFSIKLDGLVTFPGDASGS
jgi:hypothetical protein